MLQYSCYGAFIICSTTSAQCSSIAILKEAPNIVSLLLQALCNQMIIYFKMPIALGPFSCCVQG